MKRKTTRDRRASNNVEILAISAFACLLIGCFYAGVSSAINLNKSSMQRMVAQDMCHDTLSTIREATFDEVSTGVFPEETVKLGYLAAEDAQPVNGTRSYKVTQLADPQWKEITVTVSWSSGKRSFNQSVTGYVHKGGSS